jgi:hypothetical protein
MAHRTAAERRATRNRKRKQRHAAADTLERDGWEVRFVPGPRLGPGVVSAGPEEIAAAMAGLPDDLGWEWAAPRVLPAFQRVRPHPPGSPDPVLRVVPPGLPVSFSVDIGMIHVTVSDAMVEHWALPVADITAQAMVNLHERAAGVTSEQIVWGDVGGVRTGMLQTGRSIGSSLVLAPLELARILGDAPRLLIAPMRDLLVALPPDELELAAWLYGEIASDDPNHLPGRIFEFDGRAITLSAVAVDG